jgi:hypothetical protein
MASPKTVAGSTTIAGRRRQRHFSTSSTSMAVKSIGSPACSVTQIGPESGVDEFHVSI